MAINDSICGADYRYDISLNAVFIIMTVDFETCKQMQVHNAYLLCIWLLVLAPRNIVQV